MSIHRHLIDGSAFTLADTLSSAAYDPFGMCVVGEFEDALHGSEVIVAEQIVGGYTDKEASVKLRLPIGDYRRLKFAVQEKAIEYLA